MRRTFALLAVLALVAAACGTSTDDTTTSAAADTSATTEALVTGIQADADACVLGGTDGSLNLYNWTGYIPTGSLAEEFEVRDLVADFEEAFDVNVVLTEYDSNEVMLAQIDAGVGYDLVVPSDYMVAQMRDAELLVKLNQGAIPNMVNIDDLFSNPPYDPGNQFSAPYQWGTTGIGYLYDSIDDANPDEVDEAADLIKATKDRLAAFNSSSYWTLLTTGETVVAQGWNGDFLGEFDRISTDDYDAYEDYGYAIPVEGSAAWVDTMAIPVTAEHPCTAMTFINFMLDAENGAELTNYNYYASPNAAAADFIYPEILEDPSIYPLPETMEILEFFEDLGDFNTYYADAFSAAKG
jgi:spermidine/putrescine-binding protein